MKKKLLNWLASALAISLVTLFAFRHHAVAYFIEEYLRNGTLAYERFSFDRHIITLDKPRFGHVEADKAILAYQVDLLERSAEIAIIIDHPYVLIEPLTIDWNALFQAFDYGGSLLKTTVRVQVLNGDVVWDSSRHAYFSVEAAVGQHHQGGSLSIRLNDPTQEANSLVMHIFEQQAGLQAEVDCHELALSDITHLAARIFPSFRNLHVYRGIANGEINLSVPKGGNLQAQGDLTLKDLAFKHTSLNVEGECQEALLQIDPTYKGKIEFLQPASVLFDNNNGMKWDVTALTGGIFFQGHDAIQVDIKGHCTHQNQSSQVQLEGILSLPANSLPIIALGIKVDTDGDVLKTTEIAIRSLDGPSQSIEVELNRVSHHDFAFFQSILGHFWPDWKDISLRDGHLDAVVQVDYGDKGIAALKIKNLLADSIALDILPWKTSWKVQRIRGELESNLMEEDLLRSLNGDLSISNGELSWIGDKDYRTRLENIQTELAIRQGVIQKSIVGLTFRGLKGRVELDGNVPLAGVEVVFSGAVKDIYPFVPNQVQDGLQKGFDNHSVIIASHIRKGDEGVEVTGNIRLFESPTVNLDQIDFGLTCAHWPDLTCQNGWFHAKDLPLEKYISPFIIKGNGTVLSGIGEFKGTYDGQNILINYDAQDIALVNKDLAIDIPRIHTEGDLSHGDPLVAYHRFDLVNDVSEGVLPVQQATYFEKNSGLLFTDIQSKVVFEGPVVRCKELEAFSNGVYLAGESTIDFSSPQPDVFTIDMNMISFDGQVSQVRHMLSHFKEAAILAKVPLEGNLSLSGRGGSIHFDFSPGDYTWTGVADGSISEGTMKADQVDISLQDLCLEFSYDHQNNFLAFNDLQGTLLVGKKDRVDEYIVASDLLRFSDFRKREFDFDIWVGDKDRDFIRVAGSTKSRDPETIEFLINHNLTHFGQTHPAIFELALKNWSEVDAFRLQTKIQLNAFLRDLQRFQRTGLLCFSRHLLQQLDHAHTMEGTIDLNLQYDRNTSSMDYQASGDDLTFRGFHFDQFAINGKKQEKTWIIDQLLLDDLSLAADLRCHHDAWDVHFLGLRYGKALLLGLEGEYIDQGDYLDTRVNLLEVDLAELGAWNSLKPFVDLLQPQGQLHATGKMKVMLAPNPPWLQFDANLKTNGRDILLGGLQIDLKAPFECCYAPSEGFALRDVHAIVSDDALPSGISQVAIDAAAIAYDPAHAKTAVDQLHFSVPVGQLGWAAQMLSLRYPDLFSSRIQTLINESKKEGFLEGTLSLNQQGSYQNMRLDLPKGVYTFDNKDFQLSELTLEKEAQDFRFSTKWHDRRVAFWVQGKAVMPQWDHGFLDLIDSPTQKTPLHIDWAYNPQEGFSINKASGRFFGLDLALAQDPERQMHYPWVALQGEIGVDCQQALPLLSADLANKVKNWKIGSGYSLSGEWIIDQDHLGDIMDHLHFRGSLLGNEFSAKGYQIHRLKADVDYTPDKIVIQNLVTEDPAGILTCPQIALAKNSQDQWMFNAPSLHMENIRPSLLRDLSLKKPAKVKPLILKDIKLESCRGCLADVSSFQAKGSLHFLNPPKTNFRNTIFAIPAEILKRIGLDPSVMTPVTGTMTLHIKGDRIYLTRMKDVYSEGRASKFYLARRSEHSWIDFDGNINAQIRMKQYNLLFKLAELFTVTISGNIKKPVYTLQKQPHSSPGGETSQAVMSNE